MHSFQRHVALAAVFALAATAACSAGCAAPVDAPAAVAPSTKGILRVAREVHLELPSQPAGSSLRLETAGKSYDVSRHTAETRARAPGGRALTHFAKGVALSTEAPQSYDIIRVDADGSRHLVLTGIALPGAGAPDPIVAGDEESAKAIVFRDPSFMSIDTDVATKVMAHIEKSPSFARLVESITAYGQATTLDDQAKGHSGWAVTVRTLDSKGNVIMVPAGADSPAHESTHWAIAGSPEYYKNGFKDHYRLDGSGNRERIVPPSEIVALVQRDTRLAVRSDEALQGKVWSVTKDTTTRQAPVTVNAKQAREGVLAYTVDDPQWKGDRRVSVVESEGRKVTFRVENDQWRRQGIVVRFRDIDKKLLKKSDIGGSQGGAFPAFDKTLPYSSFMGVLDGRFTVLGIPFAAESAEEYTITLPEKASSFEVNVASVGLKPADLPSYLDSEPEDNAKLPGEIQTLLLDVALPTMALAIGAGAEHIKGSKIAKALAGAGVETALQLLLAGGASGTGVSVFNRDFAMEILTDVISKAPGIAAALVEWAAEMTAEKAVETALPGVGEVIDALERIGTIGQLLETLDTVASNAPFTYDRIAAAETLQVTISPKDSYFSNRATKASAYVYYGTSTVPTVATVAIDRNANGGNGPTIIPITLLSQPVGGDVRVKVTLETANGWIAGSGAGSAENQPDGANTVTVPIAVEENPTPIDEKTQYAHDSTLSLRDGKRTWVKTTTVPAAGPHDCDVSNPSRPWLCGSSSMTFNHEGVLGYGWTGSGAELKSCSNGASSVVGSMAQTINLNPSVGGPEARLQRTSCGASDPVFLAFDSTGAASGGRHVMVEKVGDSYQVYGIDLNKIGALEPTDPSMMIGRFSAKQLDAITLNPSSGVLLGLSKADNAVEVLKLAASPVDKTHAPVSKVIGGPGLPIGRLHDATGLAFLPAGAGFVVLEAGSNGAAGRVQAFTFDGASVDRFGGQPSFALKVEDAGSPVTYTDMKIDPTESYVYVSSYVNTGTQQSDFRLDIYRVGDGQLVTRTVGIVGAKMAIDQWRDLFTVGYDNLDGATWPEPSVSKWIAPPVESGK